MSRGVPRRVLEALAAQPLFSTCTDDELRKVASIGTAIDVEPGHQLTHEGRRGWEFFVVTAGEARCTIEGKEVATYGPGDFFGEMSLIDGGARTATVVAVTPMSLIVIDSREFNGMLATAPATAKRILKVMSARLRSAQVAST
jgi:CRP/FNR family transcriptional regulator, cyclic AMP receptor protein